MEEKGSWRKKEQRGWKCCFRLMFCFCYTEPTRLPNEQFFTVRHDGKGDRHLSQQWYGANTNACHKNETLLWNMSISYKGYLKIKDFSRPPFFKCKDPTGQPSFKMPMTVNYSCIYATLARFLKDATSVDTHEWSNRMGFECQGLRITFLGCSVVLTTSQRSVPSVCSTSNTLWLRSLRVIITRRFSLCRSTQRETMRKNRWSFVICFGTSAKPGRARFTWL